MNDHPQPNRISVVHIELKDRVVLLGTLLRKWDREEYKDKVKDLKLSPKARRAFKGSTIICEDSVGWFFCKEEDTARLPKVLTPKMADTLTILVNHDQTVQP